MIQNRHPNQVPQLIRDEDLVRAGVAHRLEETSARSSPFSSEEWEGWMRWDGDAESSLSLNQARPLINGKMPRIQLAAEAVVLSETHPNPRKRKSTDYDPPTFGETGDSMVPKVVKRSHTVIEKRYRTNLNQKIAALRESVPSLRSDYQETGEHEGVAPASKLNKATVLSKAMEYIQHLERRNRSLEKENTRLKGLTRSSKQKDEIAEVAMRDEMAEPRPEKASDIALPDSTVRCDTPPYATDPQGMIQVPKEIKNLRASAPQEHYAPCLCNNFEASQSSSPGTAISGQQGRDRGRLFSKLMIGSLTGLLVMEGFSERESSGDHRGLFGLPTIPSSHAAQVIRALRGKLTSANPMLSISPLFKLFLFIPALAFTLFLYLFSSKPKPSVRSKPSALAAAPSLASPIEVRQKAWLTAIQTVGVPRHLMFPELVALHLEAMKYVIIQLVGWAGYAWLTGRTEEDEIARVRAWDTAIDAQLTGGDSEVSKSRLVLTILASGTLPSTPARLMLKALHIRILLWEARKSGWSIWAILHKAAAQLARQQWLLAQEHHHFSKDTRLNLSAPREILPEHLSALLQIDSDELFTDIIVQRAYNLAWNRPTCEDIVGEDLGIDIVVEDYAIRSPLDALAAWASSVTLQRALLEWYEECGIWNQRHKRNLELALNIAPPASSAYARALAARAIFFAADRESTIRELLLEVLRSQNPTNYDKTLPTSESVFLDSSIPDRVRNDIVWAIKCTTILVLLNEQACKPSTFDEAVDLLMSLYMDANNNSLLCFAAAHQLLLFLLTEFKSQHVEIRLKGIIKGFRNWLDGPECKLDDHVHEVIRAATEKLVVPNNCPTRRFSRSSHDTGYETMSIVSDESEIQFRPV